MVSWYVQNKIESGKAVMEDTNLCYELCVQQNQEHMNGEAVKECTQAPVTYIHRTVEMNIALSVQAT